MVNFDPMRIFAVMDTKVRNLPQESLSIIGTIRILQSLNSNREENLKFLIQINVQLLK